MLEVPTCPACAAGDHDGCHTSVTHPGHGHAVDCPCALAHHGEPPTVEWGVRALVPCHLHGLKCPHTETYVHGGMTREAAERTIEHNARAVDPWVDPVLVSRTVTRWQAHPDPTRSAPPLR